MLSSTFTSALTDRFYKTAGLYAPLLRRSPFIIMTSSNHCPPLSEDLRVNVPYHRTLSSKVRLIHGNLHEKRIEILEDPVSASRIDRIYTRYNNSED